MKVWLHWNCPEDCEGYQRATPCSRCFEYDWMCQIKKRGLQKFVVVNDRQEVITKDSPDLECKSNDPEWKQYLKPCQIQPRGLKLASNGKQNSSENKETVTQP